MKTAATAIANKMNRTVYTLLSLVLLLLCSCGREAVSSAYADLPERGWSIGDTVRLAVSVQDTTQAYDLALTLRHTEQYAYQNLWLFVSACDSLSPLRADTVLACLADDRGRWLSTRTGRYYAGYVTMQHAMRFPAAGTYTFAIVQGMRDSVITGIADVGLEVRKTDRYADRPLR